METFWVLLGIIPVLAFVIVQNHLDDVKTTKRIVQLEEENRNMEYLIKCFQEAVSQEKETLYSIRRCPIEVSCDGKGEEK